MSDGRANNGAKKGEYRGQGRKPKEDEIKLIEALSIYDEIAQEKLFQGVKSGNYQFIKLFYEYRYGKPRQQVDLTTDGDKLNQVLIVPEKVATELLKDVPDDLDNSKPEDK